MDTEGKDIKKQSPKSEVYIMKEIQTTFEERVAIVNITSITNNLIEKLQNTLISHTAKFISGSKNI